MKVFWLPAETSREKIFGLDAFRGLAALLVFLFHFWTWYLPGEKIGIFGLDITALFAAGHIGVDIFFVLSGFLIFLALVWNKSLLSYFKNRFWRIFPLAFCFSVIIFLGQRDFSTTSWLDFGAHLFFLQSLFQNTYHGLDPVMWTLTVEFLFYLLLPLLLFFGRRRLWHFWMLLLVLLIVNFWYRFWISQFFDDWTAFQRIFYSEQLWGRFDQFVLGIGLGTLWVFKEHTAKFLRKFSSTLIALGLFSFFWCLALFSYFGSGFREILFLQLFLHFLTALSFSVFLLGYLFAPRALQKIFASKPLIFFGVISYSLYLWHFPILTGVHRYVEHPGTAFFIASFLLIFCSVSSYLLIERPFLKKKKTLPSLAG